VKAVLFGATGMVGQGVLRECLLDPDVESGLRGSMSQAINARPEWQMDWLRLSRICCEQVLNLCDHLVQAIRLGKHQIDAYGGSQCLAHQFVIHGK
jgi:hypothetical protein